MARSALVMCGDAAERATYAGWLRAEGVGVTETDSAVHAIEAHRQRCFLLTVAEIGPAEIDAAAFVQEIRAVNPSGELVMVSGCRDRAVSALKAGADDVLWKPVERTKLVARVARLGVSREAEQDLRERLFAEYDLAGIVVRSAAMLRVLGLIVCVAPLETTVLITGESGTGKELLATAVHGNSSRQKRPMVSINCAAIPDTLLESELFGYRKGAFTGATRDKPGLIEEARGGTLFLDEVGDLPLPLQAKLLRFLQDGSYLPVGSVRPQRADVRLIAATNAVLKDLIGEGRFRRDLYYRLSAFPIEVPPLRKRPADIVALAHHFLNRFRGETGKSVPGLSREAILYLQTRPWSGNVRELQNAIERALILSSGSLLTSADFRALDGGLDAEPARGKGLWELPPEGINLPDLTRRWVVDALERSGSGVSGAARLLGLSRPAMRYRIKKYGLGD